MDKYARIVKVLSKEILAGKYPPLGPIPSERALMKRFEAARETVRKALDILDEQRMIYRRPGRISRVSKSAVDNLKIGVMISGCTYTEIYRAISDRICELAKAKSIGVVLGDASHEEGIYNEAAITEVAQNLIDSGIKAVILHPVQFSTVSDEINRSLVKRFKDAGVQVVLVDCDIVRKPARSEIDLVDIDNFNAGRLAADHLVSRGAKNIIFLARVGCGNTVAERIKGAESVQDRAEMKAVYLQSVSDYDHIREVLASCGKFDAIIGQNDIAAMNAATVLKDMGLQVPTDVMLVGFDDVVMAAKAHPGLTSVHQPCDQIAEQAFNRAMERIKDPSLAPIHLHCGETLIVRGSTEKSWKSADRISA